MSEINFVIKTTRPITSLIAGLAMFNILLKDGRFPFWQNALQSLPIVLATMIGFILNDIYDYDKDSNGNLQRPIALGLLDRTRAYLYAILLALCAISIEGMINRFESVFVLTATLAGVAVYSPLSKWAPPIKGMATAALTLTPIMYASSVLDTTPPLFIYLATTVFIFGREILLDTKDFERDSQAGLKTLVAYMGIPLSQFTAWVLMFLGVIFYLINLNSIFGILLVGVGLIGLIIALIYDIKHHATNGGITILTLFVCVLAIPFAK